TTGSNTVPTSTRALTAATSPASAIWYPNRVAPGSGGAIMPAGAQPPSVRMYTSTAPPPAASGAPASAVSPSSAIAGTDGSADRPTSNASCATGDAVNALALERLIGSSPATAQPTTQHSGNMVCTRSSDHDRTFELPDFIGSSSRWDPRRARA